MFQVFSRRHAGLMDDWRRYGAVEVATPAAADVLGQIIENAVIARETIDGMGLGDTRTLALETDEQVTVSWQREQCVRIWRG
jgi:hypothetical protein